MSSSVSSPARRALEEFAAGRLPAEGLVAAVTGRYYGGAGRGEKAALRPVVELAERAAPGVVSLQRTEGGAGFDVRPVERAFPAESLEALRRAAAAALAADWADAVTPALDHGAASRTPDPGPRSPVAAARTPSFLSRALAAVRRFFSASG